jgi:hypothetical protein
MELTRVETRPAPGAPGRVRLVGEIVYGGGRRDELWYEVDESLADSLSESGNPWLAALLPLAATLGEPLRLCRPIDGLLRRGADEIGAVWRGWYPWLSAVSIDAPAAGEASSSPRTGAFFSGGVDSFHTVLRRREEGTIGPEELLFVAGFDLRLSRDAALRARRDRIRRIADSLGLRLVEVATNVKETRVAEADWNDLSHGSILTSCGLALERRYGVLLIASTFDYGHLHPIGSHPLTDPLLSTSATRVVHDGAAHSRCRKVEQLAGSDVALENLHVCWESGGDQNCGDCEKCLRTMVMLELAGALGRATTFPSRRLDLERVARILLQRERSYDTYYREISRWALRIGRLDVHRAIESSHRSSRLRRQAVSLAQSWRQKRVLWRAARRLRHWALQGRVA